MLLLSHEVIGAFRRNELHRQFRHKLGQFFGYVLHAGLFQIEMPRLDERFVHAQLCRIANVW